MIVVILTFLVAAPRTPAQETPPRVEPMAIVSFAGYDAFLSDLDFIGKLGGNTNLAKTFQMALKAWATTAAATDNDQTKNFKDKLSWLEPEPKLPGLDPKRPWVLAAVPNPATVIDGIAFLPVTDLKKLLSAIEPLGVKSRSLPNGASELAFPVGLPLYAKQKGDWTVVSSSPAGLDAAPDDPIPWLGGVDKRYDVAVQVLLKNIPPAMKQMAAGQLSLGVGQGLMPLSNEDDEAPKPFAGFAQPMLNLMVDRAKDLIENADTVLIGFSIDAETKKSHFDFEIIAKPDSTTAREFALVQSAASNFAGFATPEATLTAHRVGVCSKENIARWKSGMEDYRERVLRELDNQELSDQEIAKLKQLTGDLTAVILETVKAGRVDAAIAATLDPGSVTILAGVGVADGVKLEKVLRDLAQTFAGESPNLAKALKLDAETHEGVKFHALSLPIPEMDDRERIVQMVGEKLDIVVGVGPKAVYVAAGRDAATKLKAAIDQSKTLAGTKIPPMELRVAITPLVRFAAAATDDKLVQRQASMLALFLQSAGADNHLTLATEPIANGVRYRLDIEMGLLKAFGAMSQMAAMMAP